MVGENISRHGPTVKGLWLQWDSLQLREDLITRKWKSPDGKSLVYQIIVPNSCKESVLQELHDSRGRGHFGVNRTLARVRDRFYWINCRKDVEEWCKRCDRCSSKEGPRTRSKGAMMQYISGSPWERVAVDITGPFPRTEFGNKYLMVAIDYFLKWPEVVPLPNQEAVTVAEALITNVIATFGDSHWPRQKLWIRCLEAINDCSGNKKHSNDTTAPSVRWNGRET